MCLHKSLPLPLLLHTGMANEVFACSYLMVAFFTLSLHLAATFQTIARLFCQHLYIFTLRIDDNQMLIRLRQENWQMKPPAVPPKKQNHEHPQRNVSNSLIQPGGKLKSNQIAIRRRHQNLLVFPVWHLYSSSAFNFRHSAI